MRQIKKKTIGRLILYVVVTLWLFPGLIALAAGEADTQKRQILFLLDASKSMESDGQWMSAADSVLLIAAALPDSYETGILTYNTDTEVVAKLGEITADTRERLQDVELGGYTSPGATLDAAVEMFQADASEKIVLFVSDGEISMKGEEQTQEAVSRYEEAVGRAAAGGVRIDMLILPSEEIDNQILYGSETTSGQVLTQRAGQNLEEAAIEYLFDILRLKRIEIGMANTQSGELSVDLQDTFMQNGRIILVARQDIENMHLSGQCEQLEILSGNRFMVADLTRPLETQISVEYTLAEKGGMQAYLIKEYDFEVGLETEYQPGEGQYRIQVFLLDQDGKSCLTDSDLAEEVEIYLDEEKTDFYIDRGRAVIDYPLTETKSVVLRVDTEGLNSIVACEGAEQEIMLEVPVPEEEKSFPYTWLLLVLSGVGIVFVILLVLYLRARRRKAALKKNDTAPAEGSVKHEFSGKLLLYVLKAPGREDIPPASVNLFAGVDRDSFHMAWLMDKCHLGVSLSDADKIFFYSGKDHSLWFKNTGNATVMKGADILLRNKKYVLRYEEKLLLVFQDGEAEIELHYKNIKPSERER